tara:strand:+ start:431 stop:982 length:552 start_codon:yes stop_codon:yes gene_type:complete
MTATGFRNQVQNKNFLSPTGFKFILNRAPKVVFFSNQVNIPGINLGVTEQPTYLTDIPIPGDKIEFNDLNLRFLVDEDLENYLEIQHWIRGLGFPESLKEIYDWQKSNPNASDGLLNYYSDGTLNVLTSSQTPNFKVKFLNMFPSDLSDLNFDATDTDIDYLTADVTFKYTIYNITDLNDNPL